jgi:hypothetical protein
MRTKKDMIKYLKIFRETDPFAGVMLSRGQWFLGRANVDDYAITKEWRTKRRPRAQECFYNAQKFSMHHPAFGYFEGYFFIGGMPMKHAWIVMDDGHVIDFTLEAVLRKAKRQKTLVDAMTPLYYGVEVPRHYVVQRVFEMGGGGESIAKSYYASEKTASAMERKSLPLRATTDWSPGAHPSLIDEGE